MPREREFENDKAQNHDKEHKNSECAECNECTVRRCIDPREWIRRLTGCMADRMTVEGIRSENT